MKEYRDHYFLKAKQENYPARSVYKLQELDAKFKIFRRGMSGKIAFAASPKAATMARIITTQPSALDMSGESTAVQSAVAAAVMP